MERNVLIHSQAVKLDTMQILKGHSTVIFAMLDGREAYRSQDAPIVYVNYQLVVQDFLGMIQMISYSAGINNRIVMLDMLLMILTTTFALDAMLDTPKDTEHVFL